MTTIIIIKKANPNRFPIRLVRYEAFDGYWVEETDSEGYWEEDGAQSFPTETEATQYFDKRCKELNTTPNWDAQKEYDDEHGTINGYAPWQYNREE